MISSTLELLGTLIGSLWSVFTGIFIYAWSLLHWLHTDAPRLEGLLVGIALAWLLTRRDKHPAIKAASAPLKLILDIIDLAIDQVVEFSQDVWEAATGAASSVWSWAKAKVSASYNWVMSKLGRVKSDLE